MLIYWSDTMKMVIFSRISVEKWRLPNEKWWSDQVVFPEVIFSSFSPHFLFSFDWPATDLGLFLGLFLVYFSLTHRVRGSTPRRRSHRRHTWKIRGFQPSVSFIYRNESNSEAILPLKSIETHRNTLKMMIRGDQSTSSARALKAPRISWKRVGARENASNPIILSTKSHHFWNKIHEQSLVQYDFPWTFHSILRVASQVQGSVWRDDRVQADLWSQFYMYKWSHSR